jgi:hypothetical protein
MRFFMTIVAVAALAAMLVPNAMAFRFTDEARNTPTGVTGQPYNHLLSVAAGCLLVKISIGPGSLPPGLRLVGSPSDQTQNSWRIEGTPTTPGAFTFWIKGGSEWPECINDSTEEEWTIRVDQGLAIQQSSLPAGTIGKPYSTKLTAIGGGNQNWSATGLPAGLSMGADGTISGTPQAHTGGQGVQVRVTDGNRTSVQNMTIAIRNPVVVQPITVPVSGIDRAISQIVVRASGGNEVYTWAMEAAPGSLVPPGLTIAPAPTDRFAAIISGTPTRAGAYRVIVKATDGEVNWGTQEVLITVAAPVSITSTRLAPPKVGRFTTLTVRTTGGLPWVRLGRDTFKWNVEPGGKLPLGLRLNTQTGKLIGTPRKAGTYRFTLRVTDKFGTSDTQRFTLVVRK